MSNKLNALEITILNGIFGLKGEKANGGWRKLHKLQIIISPVHQILLLGRQNQTLPI
jgi:hypothetical protein